MPAGPSSTVTIRPLHPFSPNCLHMPTAGSTIQLFVTALDRDGVVVPTPFTWSPDNGSVATVNGSGVVTGVANGICSIKAQANDSGAAIGSTAVGVALLSANSLTIAYGNSTTISSVGGFPTVNWVSGAPGAAQVYAGTWVNGFVVPDHSFGDIGWNAGPTATIKTPVYQGAGTPADAHVPVQVSVGESIVRE